MTKVLFLFFLFMLGSSSVWAQQVSAQLPDGTPLEDSSFGKTSLGFSSGGVRNKDVTLQFYTLSLTQQLFDRLVMDLALPIIRGDMGGTPISEFGNTHLGMGVRTARLQDTHPLWLSVYSSVDFSNPAAETKVASRYQTYTGALILSKHFASVVFTTEGRYLHKTMEAQEGMNVGDEVQGMASLDFRVFEDWSVSGGWMFRRAFALYDGDREISPGASYGATVLGLGYDLTSELILGFKMEIPTVGEDQYRKNIASFGSIKDQSALGRTWTVSVDMAL